MIFPLDLSDNNTLTDKYVDDNFFKQEDKKELIKYSIYNSDIKMFFDEMKEHFNKVWDEEYKIEYEINSFEQLNKEIANYPSHSGYQILSDSFISDNNLSEYSKNLLGYFYNINLH